MSTKSEKMLSANITKLLFSMSLPAMFSMIIQATYGIIDGMFVAKFSEDAFTATNLAFPLQILIIAVAVGNGVGVNSTVSRSLGANDFERANSIAMQGIINTFGGWLIFIVSAFLLVPMFFNSMNQSPEILEQGITYITILYLGSIGSILHIAIEKILQATGSMVFPMLFQLTGAVVNIILDPIFIFGWGPIPEMGIKGAAIATLIGQFSAMTFSLIVLFCGKHAVKVDMRKFKFDPSLFKAILLVALPTTVMQSVMSFLAIAFNSIVGKYGDSAINVLGVYFKLQAFIYMPVFGLMQGFMPIIGFNYGAKSKARINQAIRVTLITSVTIMIGGILMFVFIPHLLLGIFDPSQEMLDIGIYAFRILSIAFLPSAITLTITTVFQALGYGKQSLMLSLLRQAIILLPLGYLFSLISLEMVWFSMPIAETTAFVIAIFTFIKVRKVTIDCLPEPSISDD